MALRLIFLIMGTSIMTLTTSPIELTDGIEKLLAPFKKVGLPAHELAMMMTIALRFIPTLIDETDKIMKTPGILLSGSNRIIENYTLIFLQHASAREPGPMWQATLKDSGSI